MPAITTEWCSKRLAVALAAMTFPETPQAPARASGRAQGGEPELESVRAAIATARQIPWLVPADTPLSSPLLSDRPSKATDVFGEFFAEMLRRIGG
jgi:hypothetical protein